MPENEHKPLRSVSNGSALILAGLAVAFLSPVLIAFGPGEYLVLPYWYVAWLMVAAGGWLLPNRLIAGIFIGIAIASIGFFLVIWVSTRNVIG